MANFWWVNQNQTYAHEVRGGYLWSPKSRADGARSQFYENMTRVRRGDVVLSYCDTYIRAIGVATSIATSVPKPTAFGRAGSYWNDEGWFVEVQFRELPSPIRPRDHMEVLEPTLPAKYSPLRANGAGGQHVYLAELPLQMARQLLLLLGQERQTLIDVLETIAQYEIAQSSAEIELESRNDIPATEKLQLAKARIGQGLFKSRVELVKNVAA
jgi:putative restriction endonuclease